MKNGVKNRNSIRMKLLSVIVPVVVITMFILVYISYYYSKNLIESQAESLLQVSASHQSVEIQSWLENNLASFETAKQTIETLKPDESQLTQILNSYYDFNKNFPEGLYIGDSQGNLYTATASAKKEQNVTSAVWYKEGLTRYHMDYGNARKGTDGSNLLSASAILDDGTDNLKVIGADLSLDKIAIIVNSAIEMQNAQAFLVDKQTGTILAHRDSENTFTDLNQASDPFLKTIGEKIVAGDSETYKDNGQMVAFENVANTDWVLVSYVPTATILSGLARLRNVMILIGALSLIVLSVLIERTINYVMKPVNKLTSVITTMTEGDFTIDVTAKGKDEIAVMGSHLKEFISAMRKMLSDVRNIADNMGEHAKESKEISGNMLESSSIQSESMKELNTTVDQLSESVNEIA